MSLVIHSLWLVVAASKLVTMRTNSIGWLDFLCWLGTRTDPNHPDYLLPVFYLIFLKSNVVILAEEWIHYYRYCVQASKFTAPLNVRMRKGSGFSKKVVTHTAPIMVSKGAFLNSLLASSEQAATWKRFQWQNDALGSLLTSSRLQILTSQSHFLHVLNCPRNEKARSWRRSLYIFENVPLQSTNLFHT